MIEAMTDGADAPADGRRVAVTRLAPPAPDPAAVGRVRALLDGAQAPLVFAGGGSRLAADRVAELAEALDAPVVTSFNGKGVLPPGHALHAGSSVRGALRPAPGRRERRLHRARHPLRRGVHLPLGGRVPARARPGRPRPGRASAATTPSPRGSSPTSAASATPCSGPASPPARGTAPPQPRAALAGRQSEVAAHGFAAERELMHQLDAALPDDALVIADMTIQSYWGVLYLDARRPGGFAYPMSGALGSGLPTALGAVAANPDAPVVVLAGDGGFLMGGHELATAQQNGLHFVTLLVNDSCFGVLKNYQMSAYGHSSSVELRSPDFEQLAAGYGVGYRRIEDTSQAGDALREAIAGLDGGCRLIELQAELAAPPQSI